MSKSPAPAAFVEPKPKRKRTKKGKPVSTPGHEMHQGTAEGASGQTHGFVPGVCDEAYHTDLDKGACRSFGEEAEIPVSSTDRQYSRQARLAARAGDCGSTHFPAEGEDPAMVKSQLGTPSANPLSKALEYMRAVSEKGAAEWAADSAAQQPAYRSAGRVAVGHSDLQQQPTYTSVLAHLQTVRGDLMGEYGPGLGGFSHAGTATVDSMDAAMAAGNYRGMGVVDHNPLRPADHQSRSGMSNGSHSLGNPVSVNPPASKASNLDIMKACLFGNG